jgi:hypothetical protein
MLFSGNHHNRNLRRDRDLHNHLHIRHSRNRNLRQVLLMLQFLQLSVREHR